MMSAEQDFRSAIIARLQSDISLKPLVNHVYDGAPVAASPPYIVVGEVIGTDWGTKDREGRELRLAIMLYDAMEKPARLAALVPIVQANMHHIGSFGVNGWDIGSLVLIRSNLVASTAGKWTAVLDFRLRVLRAD
jgi:Protein of unknown function (DUF3168)